MKWIYVVCGTVFFGILTLSPTLPAWELLRTEPLENSSREEIVLKNSGKYFNRQNNEKFSLAEKLSADGWFSVDLKPVCNINLFSDKGETCPVSFPFMPLGKQFFYGVPVNIMTPAENDNKTALLMPSKQLLGNKLPNSVEVPVGKKAKVLYFLTASYYTSPSGEQYFQINYQNNTAKKIPIVGGKQTGDWYQANSRIYTDEVRCVLVPKTKDSKTEFYNMHLHQWENPFPEEVVRSITFKTDPEAPMALFIVAVSGHF